jgi:hypothetical protein
MDERDSIKHRRNKMNNEMQLSDQALGAVMMALQKSLLQESDIVPVLKGFKFVVDESLSGELVVKNPPLVRVDTGGHMILNDGDEENS